MADSFENRLKLTADRLRSERHRVETEKAEALARAKAHLELLVRHTRAWAQNIVPRVGAAVQTANAIVQEVQIAASATQSPPPRAVQGGPPLAHLPGIQIAQAPPPAAAARAAVRSSPTTAPKPPLLLLSLDKEGNIVVQKNNYKFRATAPLNPVAFEQFKEEVIEELIAEYVNSGLLGYDPDEPIPQDEQQTGGVSESSGSSAEQQNVEQESGHDPRPTTPVARQIVAAIRSNSVTIKVTSGSFIAMLDEKISILSRQIPNSEPAKENWDREVQSYRDMKDATQSLVTAIDLLLMDAAKESPAVNAALSVAGGLRSWWTKSHSEICERGFDSGLFALGVMLCHFAGAGGEVAAVISATVVKGAPVVDALKAWASQKEKDAKKDK
ncbi:hypothetical protein HNQ36_003055 [Afipia massiliensis]|uniref:Uncharacterized protein n=1 Tax=Afipia massiliensis TaxID=211460 RepID=A0A840N384_9BRAD|nr:hypothetical protein [Afipia massiliensis]MBB5053064.1 hypothetical protein [Afipia massiliensis]